MIDFATPYHVPEDISTADWAEKHISISTRMPGRIKGPFRLRNAPWLRG